MISFEDFSARGGSLSDLQAGASGGKNMISYESFKQLDLRIAKILEAERVEGSEKLLKFIVDIGEEKRQILAGIGRRYDPEALIGKEIVIIANLEPRMLMGFESQGMLLATDDEEGPVFLTPEKEVPPGKTVH